MILAGCLDVNSSKKRPDLPVLHCFNIPLLVLVDVPILPGTDQEWNGFIAHLVIVYRVINLVGKAMVDAMNIDIGADTMNCLKLRKWGAKGASEIIFKKEINEAEDHSEAVKRSGIC
jgi:propionyl-CoA carboxylase beta chain